MTTYILAGTLRAASLYAIKHDIGKPGNDKGVLVLPQTHTLEGRNIVPGDSVLFGYGCTADMIDKFMHQCWSRGIKLSDLRIITYDD